MKILIINTLYSPYKIGGAEVSVQLLAEGLFAQGHNVRVLCLHPDSARKTSFLNGVEIIYLPLKNMYWPFNGVCKPGWKRLFWHLLDLYNPMMRNLVDREINSFKPDVVHTNNLAGFSVSVWSCVKAHKIKLIHTMRDYYLFHPNCTLFKNGKNISVGDFSVRAWSWLKKRISRNVDVAVGISQYISKLHSDNDFFVRAKHIHIYNPVNIPKVNRGNDSLCVGFIGRLSIDKGFDDFCSIAEKYNKVGIRFIAAGRFGLDRESDILKKRATSANIELLGFSTLEAFLDIVDVVILPVKWQEPFGRTIVECALAGKHVFTNSVGGISEIISHFKNVRLMSDIEKLNLIYINSIINNKTDILNSETFSLKASLDGYLRAYMM